jgi:hypothetical protein
MTEVDIQYVSNESGEPTETAYLLNLKSEE